MGPMSARTALAVAGAVALATVLAALLELWVVCVAGVVALQLMVLLAVLLCARRAPASPSSTKGPSPEQALATRLDELQVAVDELGKRTVLEAQALRRIIESR